MYSFPPFGPGDRPSEKEAGGEDKKHKDEIREPGELVRGEFDLEEIEWQRKKQGDKKCQPESERGTGEEIAGRPVGEKLPEPTGHREAGLQKREIQRNRAEEDTSQKRAKRGDTGIFECRSQHQNEHRYRQP